METAEEPQSCSRVIIFTSKIAGVNLRESLALPPHPTVPLPAAELVFRGKNICRNISSKFETLLPLSYSELLSAESRNRSVFCCAESRQLPLCCFFSAPTWTRINRPTHPGFYLPTAAIWLRFRNYVGLYF